MAIRISPYTTLKFISMSVSELYNASASIGKEKKCRSNTDIMLFMQSIYFSMENEVKTYDSASYTPNSSSKILILYFEAAVGNHFAQSRTTTRGNCIFVRELKDLW